MKYLFDFSFVKVKYEIKHQRFDNDGLSDSVRALLASNSSFDKYILNLLLAPF